ncbi:L-threonylcarbamoyladenylate synthase [Entomortierella parvispora]|uniref:Threonylcarbamoyl-AMP synthase n=1 Tax=Entomortierella parvispora TaxID=205924 RepID=A0A9P3HIU4_9FUNG|nr:L-threonylcarbamoyladenylate synthase [Entomortierella parvispora]
MTYLSPAATNSGAAASSSASLPQPSSVAPLFTTLLEKIDPASITYTSTSDLEDPVPIISDPHTRQVLESAAKLLRAGQVVGMPTETVYGLAANALDSVAAKRIFEAKNRPQDNPLIVHVSSLKMLRSMLKDNTIPEVYTELIKAYWPGALTLLFPRSALIPNEITCAQPTVAVRFPSHPITRALITACELPLAAPSANSSGKPSPTLASHVMDDLAGKIPMIIDGGQCSFGIESTVVDGLRVPPAILRPGGVTYEQIRMVKGMEGVQVYKKHFTDVAMEQTPTTPGMKYRHYSPEAEVVLVEYGASSDVGSKTSDATTAQYSVILKEIDRLKKEGKRRFGILRTSFSLTAPLISRESSSSLPESQPREVIEFPLGQGSKPEDVARELFKGLRYLDGQKVDCIFVEGISEDDEGLAVMNRLRKAASRTIS